MSALPPALHSLVTLDEDHPQTQHSQTASQCTVRHTGGKKILQQCVEQKKNPVLLSKTLHRTNLTSSNSCSLTMLKEQLYLMPQSHQPREPAEPFCHSAVGSSHPATSMHRDISVHTGSTSGCVSVWACKLVISCQPLKTELRCDSTKATKTIFNKETAIILLRYTLGQIQLQVRIMERLPLALWELHMIFM